jgi:hypothetical protein
MAAAVMSSRVRTATLELGIEAPDQESILFKLLLLCNLCFSASQF